jgi:hypothetical protein
MPERAGRQDSPKCAVLWCVCRIDRANTGVIVGLRFGPPERAIVRWVGQATFEALEDVTNVRAA